MNKKISASIASKLSLITFVLIFVACTLVGTVAYVVNRDNSLKYTKRTAMSIAESVAGMVDKKAFAEILETGEKTAYWHEMKASLSAVKADTGVKYIYALDSSYKDEMMFIVEGQTNQDDPEMICDLGDTLGTEIFVDELFETIKTGEPTTSDPYVDDVYGTLISAHAAIFDDNGRIIGILEVDLDVNEVMATINRTGAQTLIISIAAAMIFGLVIVLYSSRKIGKPLQTISEASSKLADGDIDIRIDTGRKDEIGVLARQFENMAKSLREQQSILSDIADGNYAGSIQIRSDRDAVNMAISTMLDSNNEMISEIRMTAGQVAMGAAQIADGAQILASGSTEQAASITQLSESISGIQRQAEQNAKLAEKAMEEVAVAGQLMGDASEYMDQMNAAMTAINESSENIARVIGTIDSIAFQTNILALNAAVEAARAGQHGKGFSVVAEEVRNLATKSAEAAKETADMIQHSKQAVDTGTQIAIKTSESLSKVGVIAESNAKSMQFMTEASRQQSLAISEVNTGIEQISQVVQANTASAEESAASAQEMSAQSSVLNQIVSRFHLRG